VWREHIRDRGNDRAKIENGKNKDHSNNPVTADGVLKRGM
jgi:hypothetical protein